MLGSTFIVGVEDGPDGTTKVYIDHRSRGLYVLVEDEAAQHEVRRAWSGTWHVLIPVPPPEAILQR